MSLEDDNKAEETATSTSTTSSSTTAAPTTTTDTVQSSTDQTATSEEPQSGLVDSTVETAQAAKSKQMKQKRSFDEINNSNDPTSTEVAVVDGKCDDSEEDCNLITTTNGEEEEADEKMITDEEEVVHEVEEVEEVKPEPVLATFKVVYAKQNYEVNMDLNARVAELKTQIAVLTGVTEKMQKLCYRGNLDDSKSLQESGIKEGVKIMMIGSRMDDIKSIDSNKPEASKVAPKEKPTKEPLCQMTQHKKILDKGIPEYATPGWMNDNSDLPPEPLTGMTNKYGNKVRLTFKFETDEVWIGTKERTQKLQMTSIKSVIAEPIELHPEYHLMGLQVGPTEASRIWFYWVPTQYVKAIKRAILGD